MASTGGSPRLLPARCPARSTRMAELCCLLKLRVTREPASSRSTLAHPVCADRPARCRSPFVQTHSAPGPSQTRPACRTLLMDLPMANLRNVRLTIISTRVEQIGAAQEPSELDDSPL